MVIHAAFLRQTVLADTLCPCTRDVACLPVSTSEFMLTSEFVSKSTSVSTSISARRLKIKEVVLSPDPSAEAEGGGSKPGPVKLSHFHDNQRMFINKRNLQNSDYVDAYNYCSQRISLCSSATVFSFIRTCESIT